MGNYLIVDGLILIATFEAEGVY